MKSTYLILAIPFLFYLGAAVVLEPGALVPMYPDADLTAYLAAESLAKDGNLAYTREDSDRYMQLYGERPFPFRVLQKRIMDSTGHYRNYYAFHDPELFLFVLTPFVGLLGFRGWFVLHALLVLGIYVIGWMYYRGKDPEAISPAINSVVYFTLLPLPLLFLLPSHHLFLVACSAAFFFFGVRGSGICSAIFLALAVSSQPWAIVLGAFPLAYWQIKKTAGKNPTPRFVIAAAVAMFAVWGAERLMYPVANVSEPRWIMAGDHAPLSGIWNSLPVARRYGWTSPNLHRLIDFLFGRNSGFFVYAFVAGALFLSSVWLLRDGLVRSAWLFVILFLATLSTIHTSAWNSESFANDFWVLLAPLPYFVVPLIRPKQLFVSILVPGAFLAGPLLMNPLGAIANRSHYTFSFPYKYLPIEISLVGRAGITGDSEYQQNIPKGKVYFLNDSFYTEKDYFWLRGESTLEFLLEVPNRQPLFMEFRNGVLENKIKLKFDDSEVEVRLSTAETSSIDLTSHLTRAVPYEGKVYLHGRIATNTGYVPGLLTRDNPDYRFLSCQIQFTQPQTTP